jgi:hypothetical protein
MPVVVGAVIVVGVLCLFDLLLTLGVIRRLREHTDLLRELQAPAGSPVIGLAAGQGPEPFTAQTADGTSVAGPAGLRLAAFFSASCSVCPGRVAPFIEYVRANQLGRDDVLAVLVVTDLSAPPRYLSDLAGIARVCVQPDDSELARAFSVTGYPAFCLLDSVGNVVSSGHTPAAMPAAAMAAR